MNKDLKSLLHYIQIILKNYSSKLEPSTISCLKEILNPRNGGIFSFKNEIVEFKIPGLGDHMIDINYIVYIVCRLILDIKDYSIVFPNINDNINSIHQKIKSMNKNELIGVAARIRDKLGKRGERRNLNFIVHCEELKPPKHIQKWLDKNEGNPFSKEWTPDILLLTQNIIIDILIDNEQLIYIIDNDNNQIEYEKLIQTELINSLSELLISKSNFKKASDETISLLINYIETLEKNTTAIKNITGGVGELSICMTNSHYFEILKENIIMNNYYKKKPDALRKTMHKLEKEKKQTNLTLLKDLKERNIISFQEFLDYSCGNTTSQLDLMKRMIIMQGGCDGLTIKENR